MLSLVFCIIASLVTFLKTKHPDLYTKFVENRLSQEEIDFIVTEFQTLRHKAD